MRVGLIASGCAHTALVLFGLLSLGATPLQPEVVESISVELIPVTEFTNIREGSLDSTVIETETPSAVHDDTPPELAQPTGNTEEDQPAPQETETPTRPRSPTRRRAVLSRPLTPPVPEPIMARFPHRRASRKPSLSPSRNQSSNPHLSRAGATPEPPAPEEPPPLAVEPTAEGRRGRPPSRHAHRALEQKRAQFREAQAAAAAQQQQDEQAREADDISSIHQQRGLARRRHRRRRRADHRRHDRHVGDADAVREGGARRPDKRGMRCRRLARGRPLPPHSNLRSMPAATIQAAPDIVASSGEQYRHRLRAGRTARGAAMRPLSGCGGRKSGRCSTQGIPLSPQWAGARMERP